MKLKLPLDKMTRAEKLRTMEALWDDLCRTSGNFPSPAWHGVVLDRRETMVRRGRGKFIDWEEAKSRIRKNLS